MNDTAQEKDGAGQAPPVFYGNMQLFAFDEQHPDEQQSRGKGIRKISHDAQQEVNDGSAQLSEQTFSRQKHDQKQSAEQTEDHSDRFLCQYSL